jgi:alpha-ketoglutarate-dependent taurine dioxygenase
MSSDEFARIAGRHSSRVAQIGLLRNYLADRGPGVAVRPEAAADFVELNPDELESFLDELVAEGAMVRRDEWVCRACDEPIQGELEEDGTRQCDECARHFKREEVDIEACYYLRRPLVVRPLASLEGATVEMGQNPLRDEERLRRARVTPWKTLAEDKFTLPIDALEGGDKSAALRMLHEYGIMRIRMHGDAPSVERLLSLETWIGPARQEQNDFRGKVKSLVPNYDAPANTGDSSRELAPHVDGTQDERTPIALAFQYDAGGKWGAESTFLDMTAMLAALSESDLERILATLSRTGCATCTKSKINKKTGENWSKTFNGPIVRVECSGGAVSIRLRDDDLLQVIPDCQREFDELRELVRAWSAEGNLIRYTPQDGDIVVFDNWRVLHGRKAVGGNRQRIHDRMWFDRLLPEYDGQHSLGIRPLGNMLMAALEVGNAQ